VALGIRYPVELGGEAFTLRMLDAAHQRFHWKHTDDRKCREHLTYALFPFDGPALKDEGHPFTIDTAEDYEAVKRYLEGQPSVSPVDGGPWSPC
jgi:hypothetical protein